MGKIDSWVWFLIVITMFCILFFIADWVDKKAKIKNEKRKKLNRDLIIEAEVNRLIPILLSNDFIEIDKIEMTYEVYYKIRSMSNMDLELIKPRIVFKVIQEEVKNEFE